MGLLLFSASWLLHFTSFAWSVHFCFSWVLDLLYSNLPDVYFCDGLFWAATTFLKSHIWRPPAVCPPVWPPLWGWIYSTPRLYLHRQFSSSGIGNISNPSSTAFGLLREFAVSLIVFSEQTSGSEQFYAVQQSEDHTGEVIPVLNDITQAAPEAWKPTGTSNQEFSSFMFTQEKYECRLSD